MLTKPLLLTKPILLRGRRGDFASFYLFFAVFLNFQERTRRGRYIRRPSDLD